jgi:hypothetical protein
MKKHVPLLPLLLFVAVAMSVGPVGRAGDDHDRRRKGRRHRCEKETVEIDEIRLFLEYNYTDQDLGLQLELGAEPWRKLKIYDPCGEEILEVEGESTLKDFGLADLFFESNEPSFDEVSLAEILAAFPEGEYRFVGRTIEGDKLVGVAELTHDIPDAPVIASPEEDEEIDPGDFEVSWLPVTTPSGIEIVAYQVIVTNADDEFFRYDVRVPADLTSLTVPAEFFEPGVEYELEVIAVEESGNQTISLLFFTTPDEE